MGAHTLGRWGGDQWEESVMSCDGFSDQSEWSIVTVTAQDADIPLPVQVHLDGAGRPPLQQRVLQEHRQED